MSLADLIEAEPIRRGGIKCMTCTWRDSLSPEDRETFQQAVQRIRATGAGTPQLHAACKKMGLDVKQNTLGNHIRGGHQ